MAKKKKQKPEGNEDLFSEDDFSIEENPEASEKDKPAKVKKASGAKASSKVPGKYRKHQ